MVLNVVMKAAWPHAKAGIGVAILVGLQHERALCSLNPASGSPLILATRVQLIPRSWAVCCLGMISEQRQAYCRLSPAPPQAEQTGRLTDNAKWMARQCSGRAVLDAHRAGSLLLNGLLFLNATYTMH